jgi:uncharacterized protein
MRWIAHTAASAVAPVAEAADALAGVLPGAAQRQRASLGSTAHRPWLLPARPWVMGQSWCDLLFAHWPVPADQVRAHVPPALELDLYDGEAWVSVTPFEVRGTRLRGVLPPPLLSRFPELNVRTYVTLGGRPGVYFFSLDAGNPAAVAGARLIHLSYFYAWMGVRRRGDEVAYASRRLGPAPLGARFRGRYRPVGRPYEPAPGSLAYFLTERYCLYTVDRRGEVGRLEIHHPPWPLQDAEAEIELNTMTAPVGLALPDVAPRLHYVGRQDMVAWLPQAVGAPAPRRSARGI